MVGHSLGAGTAALLATHLRSIYKNTYCWAYAPPGGLCSRNLAFTMNDFVTSVVVGKDIVPRLSIRWGVGCGVVG